jgi:membrane-associated protein
MMSDLAQWALTNLAVYGLPILLLVSYVGSLGIPFPITLVIVAAGAITREGLIDWKLAVLACMIGAALADQSEFLLGRMGSHWLEQHFGEKLAWRRAQATFRRQGGWAILLTRFWFTPLAPAINVIAGSKYPYARFLLFDVLGQLLWVLLYGGLGYIFYSQWLLISQAVSGFSGISAGVVILVGVVYFGMKCYKKTSARKLM